MAEKKGENEKEKLIQFVETENVSLKGYTLIEGFPDIGIAGTIRARYLVEKLKFEQIGYIHSKVLLPIIRINDGMPVHPIRIYVKRKNKVVIVIAEQIIDNVIAAPMAEELVLWIKKKGINRIISTSGVKIIEGKSVYAFASNDKSKKLIKKIGLDMINEGITSGVTALLMLKLKDNNIEAFCLLGNARNNADYNAAAEVVKAICSITGMTLDVKPLLDEAKKLEEAIVQHLKTIESTKEAKPDSSTPMYV